MPREGRSEAVRYPPPRGRGGWVGKERPPAAGTSGVGGTGRRRWERWRAGGRGTRPTASGGSLRPDVGQARGELAGESMVPDLGQRRAGVYRAPPARLKATRPRGANQVAASRVSHGGRPPPIPTGHRPGLPRPSGWGVSPIGVGFPFARDCLGYSARQYRSEAGSPERRGFRAPSTGALVGVAQVVRAPGCGPGGRRFKSGRSPWSKRQRSRSRKGVDTVAAGRLPFWPRSEREKVCRRCVLLERRFRPSPLPRRPESPRRAAEYAD